MTRVPRSYADGRLRSRPGERGSGLAPGLVPLDAVGLPDHLLLAPREPGPSDAGPPPRCWVAHGTADRVLPVERCGRPVRARLERLGCTVRDEEFDGGHVVPALLASSFAWELGDGRSG